MRKKQKRIWGVLGKQQSFVSAKTEGQTIPLNANPFNSWDAQKSRYKRVDLIPKNENLMDNIQQGGVVGTPTVTPLPQYLIDIYTGATRAYSVRKLSNSYTGAAIRVRRSADDTEQDIGFIGECLDNTDLLNFVAGTDGYIVKWYDQSGNGIDFEQTNNSDQPIIVSNGNLYELSNIGITRPAILFQTTTWLQNGILSGYTDASIFSVLQSNEEGKSFWDFNNDADSVRASHPHSNTETRENAFITTTEVITINGSELLTQHIWGACSSNNDYKVSRNGTNIYSSNTTVVEEPVTNGKIGTDSSTSDFFNGYFQELVIWYSNQDVNLKGITDNMNNFYGVA